LGEEDDNYVRKRGCSMMRKNRSKIITGTLAVGMLLSQGAPFNVLAESPYELRRVDQAVEILNNLSLKYKEGG